MFHFTSISGCTYHDVKPGEALSSAGQTARIVSFSNADAVTHPPSSVTPSTGRETRLMAIAGSATIVIADLRPGFSMGRCAYVAVDASHARIVVIASGCGYAIVGGTVTLLICGPSQLASPVPFTASPNGPILVIGSSGQVGAAVVNAWGKELCVGTYHGHADCSPCHAMPFDLTAAAANPSVSRELLRMVRPSVVVICAGCTWAEECEKQPERATAWNATAPTHLAAAATELGIKVVYLSSEYVHDGHNGPYSESEAPTPLSAYARSKVEGERGVAAANPLALIIRTTVVYGPDAQGKNFACQLERALQNKHAMRIPSDQVSSPTYNVDLARAIRLLVERGLSGVFNVAGPQVMSREQLAVILAPLLVPGASTSLLQFLPTSELGQLARRPLKAGLRIDKLKQALPALEMRGPAQAMQEWSTTRSLPTPLTSKLWYAPNKFQAYGDREIQAVIDCLLDGWLVPGPRTEQFENIVAAYFNKQCAVMTNSGSSANIIALSVLDLPAGTEIVTPACSFATVLAPIMQLGLKPILVDVVPTRYVPTVDAIVAAITPKTKVLMIPNLVGSSVDWKELRKRVHTDLGRTDIVLFEDSCDTMTHTPHSDISVISFYASHVITAGGCGGCCMFNDPKLKKKALMYRDWGRIGDNREEASERFCYSVDGIEYDFKFLYGVRGYNMKCSEMNAAFGLVQMERLESLQHIRATNIDRFVNRLAGTRYVVPDDHHLYNWLAMPLLYHDRAGILRYLESQNIQVRCTFAGNISRHPAFRELLADFPGADRVMREGFLLGAHHGMTLKDVDAICDFLIAYDKGLVGAEFRRMAAQMEHHQVGEQHDF